ncbi:hypothetical protein [Kosakonia sacchari]|uniref:hypothetical protein n=1 Tax=Kosakonia sacchari TaxID=1158459 RepID=UPI0015856E9B|nr:hypothetical protein [Kosakonia sacchari]NUL35042.1 hypothetical protein [Kosakonia sacchari]
MFLGKISSKDWMVTVGTLPVIGLAEGSNIQIAMNNDQISVSTGIGGDWTFVENPDVSAGLTFTTQRNSPSNTVLAQMQQNGSVFPVSLTNTRNLTRHTIGYGMFSRRPTDGANNGAGAQSLEWTILTGEVDSTIIGAIVF